MQTLIQPLCPNCGQALEVEIRDAARSGQPVRVERHTCKRPVKFHGGRMHFETCYTERKEQACGQD